jgi:hypothetical protein
VKRPFREGIDQGVMRGGASAILGVEGGGAPGGSSAREPVAAAPAGRPGEEDDRAGWAGWANH